MANLFKTYSQNLELSGGEKIKVIAHENSIVSVKIMEILDKETPNEITEEAIKQIREYFEEERKHFDLPIDLSTGGAFYKQVWEQLLTIPYGSTISYKELAIKVGNPKASRAVGLANGKNPIPIIVPCHRVIGSNGKLTGYALGLDMKRQLLRLEGVIKQQSLFN